MPCNIHNTVVPEDDWHLGRQGRQSGTGVGQGLVAGRVAWLTGSCGRQGRVAGRIWWLARSGGRQGGWKGMDLLCREFSGVNVIM